MKEEGVSLDLNFLETEKKLHCQSGDEVPDNKRQGRRTLQGRGTKDIDGRNERSVKVILRYKSPSKVNGWN